MKLSLSPEKKPEKQLNQTLAQKDISRQSVPHTCPFTMGKKYRVAPSLRITLLDPLIPSSSRTFPVCISHMSFQVIFSSEAPSREFAFHYGTFVT